MSTAPSGQPYRLLTVNNAPARAKLLIGRVTTALADQYQIVHVGNCLSKDEVKEKVTDLQPDILCCASMWTPEESAEMHSMARSVRPDIHVHAIPQGLQVREGPDAIVAHLTEALPNLLA
ncbi:uncharacterized protein SPSK_05634 [Sporothrix schenckii 1099-18]|uniref:Uncharacterized protein n=2 Tax=Sporothrix schenckii TaxID=29908 RepID=U7Q6T9_SPOS1|nr:uncharacterized protein SPSK_05634 [Sporothrix schenckii 1099-18]ERT02426.1 hypothetical protein HMPREF1624_00724 [Sporothrix schenckii ATCC 58251]KJR80304.1 hypothetical protein SPSK_05634 [Sporothrix schenckii 1099-18]